MNKNLFRIVFNRVRGMRMVVQESAMASGKTGSGETASTRRTGGASEVRTPLETREVDPMRDGAVGPATRSLAGTGAALSMAAAATFGLSPAQAQIVANPQAPGSQRPTVLPGSNGVTVVNIVTPSAAGVSCNRFSQFDVNAAGAVLNNSRTEVKTSIGAYVTANPWLATGPAKVILGEVDSVKPSLLRGPVEVAGSRAEVVIANPAGISVDGASFINASRVTLTTGTPVLSGGSLESYVVRGGTIVVDGQGIDLRNADYGAIYARAVQANARILAQDLTVVAPSSTRPAA